MPGPPPRGRRSGSSATGCSHARLAHPDADELVALLLKPLDDLPNQRAVDAIGLHLRRQPAHAHGLPCLCISAASQAPFPCRPCQPTMMKDRSWLEAANATVVPTAPGEAEVRTVGNTWRKDDRAATLVFCPLQEPLAHSATGAPPPRSRRMSHIPMVLPSPPTTHWWPPLRRSQQH